MYVCNCDPKFYFTLEYLTETKVIALKSNLRIMCNMPKVAPILGTYFADPELGHNSTLCKTGNIFSRTTVGQKGEAQTQKVVLVLIGQVE